MQKARWTSADDAASAEARFWTACARVRCMERAWLSCGGQTRFRDMVSESFRMQEEEYVLDTEAMMTAYGEEFWGKYKIRRRAPPSYGRNSRMSLTYAAGGQLVKRGSSIFRRSSGVGSRASGSSWQQQATASGFMDAKELVGASEADLLKEEASFRAYYGELRCVCVCFCVSRPRSRSRSRTIYLCVPECVSIHTVVHMLCVRVVRWCVSFCISSFVNFSDVLQT